VTKTLTCISTIDGSVYPERPGFMADFADQVLAPLVIGDTAAFLRTIARAPHGVIFVIAPVNLSLDDCDQHGCAAAGAIGKRPETGAVFMNRCNDLDPALCWIGCEDTDRGAGLSVPGCHALTHPKFYHLKKG